MSALAHCPQTPEALAELWSKVKLPLLSKVRVVGSRCPRGELLPAPMPEDFPEASESSSGPQRQEQHGASPAKRAREAGRVTTPSAPSGTFAPLASEAVVSVKAEVVSDEETGAPTPPSPTHWRVPEFGLAADSGVPSRSLAAAAKATEVVTRRTSVSPPPTSRRSLAADGMVEEPQPPGSLATQGGADYPLRGVRQEERAPAPLPAAEQALSESLDTSGDSGSLHLALSVSSFGGD